jgi:two-component system chemotaxis sensor kinase CheA
MLETSWRIDLHLSDPQAQPTRWVVAVLRRLSALGRVVHANPPLLAIDTGRFEGRLRLILASLLSRDRLEQELRSLVGEDGFALEAEPPSRNWVAPRESRARWVRVRAEQLDELLEGILELRLEQGRIKSKLGSSSEALREHVERSEFQLKELYGLVMELRLVPFDSVGHRLHQAVRDLARELGKEVDFRIDGGHVRLDRLVLDALLDPLLHVLRNALDHGLESPDEREEAGKPRTGSVRLGLERHGDRVRFSVRDDGRGLDAERLKRKALDLGLIGIAEAASLTDDEAWMLTTLPRFSTAKEVSHISGRGVGLDVVRASLERMGGLLQIRSRTGQGVELNLWVPPTLAVIQTLLVRCQNGLYAVPLDAVERTIDLADARGDGTSGDLRLVRLGERLGLDARADAGSFAASMAVLLRGCGSRTALVVDEVVGSRDLVVKPFRGPLARLREYSGAALMADGSIAIVLDPFHLTTEALRASGPERR